MDCMTKPQLIVTTPIRNEAWILEAFLTATSLWADRIILIDQQSTDGSREIAQKFQKVTLLDNPYKEINMAATRRILFQEVKKIQGDIILFTLDADEFWSGDFLHSAAWNKIITSEPGEIFDFYWMNLQPGGKTYTRGELPYDWVVHVDEHLWTGSYPDNYIHEPRMPWPSKVKKEHIIEVDDMALLHFARYNGARQANKERFYQISLMEKMKLSGVGMYRSYHDKEVKNVDYFTVPENAFCTYSQAGIDLPSLIRNDDIGEYYLSESRRILQKDGTYKYHKLDIWSDEFCGLVGVANPTTWYDRLIHSYLRRTMSMRKSFIIRAIDKILKIWY